VTKLCRILPFSLLERYNYFQMLTTGLCNFLYFVTYFVTENVTIYAAGLECTKDEFGCFRLFSIWHYTDWSEQMSLFQVPGSNEIWSFKLCYAGRAAHFLSATRWLIKPLAD